MTLKHLCILLLALVASGFVVGQSEDIPVENDNQFPPDTPSASDLTFQDGGSGDGPLEEPLQGSLDTNEKPPLEEMQPNALSAGIIENTSSELPCPNPCVCNTEGETNDFVVDCSGYGLTEFPGPLDSRITKLKVHNNKLTEIPNTVSNLKNLKVLTANDNSIMEINSGSISELPELVVLTLSNNKLIEYPKDLKNSFSLTKLEELDLGGNDMRTPLSSEIFSNFKSLRKLTLPISTQELLENLCGTLKETLETVCTESCSTKSFECPDAPSVVEPDMLDVKLPGELVSDGNEDPSIISVAEEDNNTNVGTEEPKQIENVLTTTPLPTSDSSNDNTIVQVMSAPVNTIAEDKDDKKTDAPGSTVAPDNIAPIVEPASRSRSTNNNEQAPSAKLNEVVDIPKDDTTKTNAEVKVGATTTDAKSGGGVDKSVIAIIVAGMVLVVAGIVIKKNWTSIRKRFSSSSRTPNERSGPNTNGSAPEEVPLQGKSPV